MTTLPNGEFCQFECSIDENNGAVIRSDKFTIFDKVNTDSFAKTSDFLDAAYPISIEPIATYGLYQKVKITVANFQPFRRFILGDVELPVIAQVIESDNGSKLEGFVICLVPPVSFEQGHVGVIFRYNEISMGPNPVTFNCKFDTMRLFTFLSTAVPEPDQKSTIVEMKRPENEKYLDYNSYIEIAHAIDSHSAVSNLFAELVEVSLEKKLFAADYQSDDGLTPVICGSAVGLTKLVSHIFESEEIKGKETCAEGFTALDFALCSHQSELIVFLLSKEIRVTPVDPAQFFEEASMYQPLNVADFPQIQKPEGSHLYAALETNTKENITPVTPRTKFGSKYRRPETAASAPAPRKPWPTRANLPQKESGPIILTPIPRMQSAVAARAPQQPPGVIRAATSHIPAKTQSQPGPRTPIWGNPALRANPNASTKPQPSLSQHTLQAKGVSNQPSRAQQSVLETQTGITLPPEGPISVHLWDKDMVYEWCVNTAKLPPEFAEKLRSHMVDGKALVVLDEDQMYNYCKIPYGLAIKLKGAIKNIPKPDGTPNSTPPSTRATGPLGSQQANTTATTAAAAVASQPVQGSPSTPRATTPQPIPRKPLTLSFGTLSPDNTPPLTPSEDSQPPSPGETPKEELKEKGSVRKALKQSLNLERKKTVEDLKEKSSSPRNSDKKATFDERTTESDATSSEASKPRRRLVRSLSSSGKKKATIDQSTKESESATAQEKKKTIDSSQKSEGEELVAPPLSARRSASSRKIRSKRVLEEQPDGDVVADASAPAVATSSAGDKSSKRKSLVRSLTSQRRDPEIQAKRVSVGLTEAEVAEPNLKRDSSKKPKTGLKKSSKAATPQTEKKSFISRVVAKKSESRPVMHISDPVFVAQPTQPVEMPPELIEKLAELGVSPQEIVKFQNKPAVLAALLKNLPATAPGSQQQTEQEIKNVRIQIPVKAPGVVDTILSPKGEPPPPQFRAQSAQSVRLEQYLTPGDPDDFIDLHRIGQGAFGVVYRAFDIKTQQSFAIKECSGISKDSKLKPFVDEIQTMSGLSHPCIVHYQGCYRKGPTTLWLVMELMDGCPLSKILELHELCPLTEPQIARVILNMLEALMYLHNLNIIHRDLKSDNILLNSDGQVKLADFGAAYQLESPDAQRLSIIGTPYWMAPEVAAGTGYGSKADVWSLGIILFEMVDGQPPYSDLPPINAILLMSTDGPPPLKNIDNVSSEILSFLELTLVIQPEDRFSAAEMSAHEFNDKAGHPSEMQLLLVDYLTAAEHMEQESKSFLDAL